MQDAAAQGFYRCRDGNTDHPPSRAMANEREIRDFG